jgi:hypothetical protein
MQLPSELQWLEWVVGSDWPEGDEDALWRLAEAWNQAALDLMQVIEDGNRSATNAALAMDGDAAEKFKAHWEQYTTGETAYLVKLTEQCEQIAQHCDSTATEVEYAKYQFILALIILAIQIAYMLAMAAATFGASTAGIPVATAATQITVRVIAQRLLQSILMGAGMNVGMDLLVQTIQVAEGHRDGYDLAKTGQAALDGAVSGAIGGGLGLGASKFARISPTRSCRTPWFRGLVEPLRPWRQLSSTARISRWSRSRGGVSGGIGGAVDHGTQAAKGGGGPDLAPPAEGIPNPKAYGDAPAPTGGDSGPPVRPAAGSTPDTTPTTHNTSGASTPDSTPTHTTGTSTPDTTPTQPAGGGGGDRPAASQPTPHTGADSPAGNAGGNRYSQVLNTDASPAVDHTPSTPAAASPAGPPPAGPTSTVSPPPDSSPTSPAVDSTPAGPSGPTSPAVDSAPSGNTSPPGTPGTAGPAVDSAPAASAPPTSGGPGPQGSGLSSVDTAPAPPAAPPSVASSPGTPTGPGGIAGQPGPAGPAVVAAGPVPSGGSPVAASAATSVATPQHSGTSGTSGGPAGHRGDRVSGWQSRSDSAPPTAPHHDTTADAGTTRSGSDSTPPRHDATTDAGTTHASSDSDSAPPPPVRLSDGTEYPMRYGPDSTPGQLPFEQRLSDVVNEKTFPPQGPDDTRTPAQRFLDLKNTNADLLTPEQRAAVAEVRNHETVQDGDVMSKVLTFSAAESYVTNGSYHDSVIGFVAKFDDVRPLDTPAAQFEGLGLDYGSKSPFRADQDHYYSIRWEAEDASQYAPAYSSDMAGTPGTDPNRLTPIGLATGEMQYTPYTGNGHTLSEYHATPEFRVDGGGDGKFGGVDLPDGAEIWRVNSDGTQSPVAVFQEGQWSHVEGTDLSDLGGTHSDPDPTPGDPSDPAHADHPEGGDPGDPVTEHDHPEYVSDEEALSLVRDNVQQTQSGYSFYPQGDELHQFADAVPPHDGTINLDLHGSEHGFHIDGRVMTGEQFARAIRQLEAEGVVNLDGGNVRLSSCDIARGDDSPAAQFAREAGVSVTAPTERLWTSLAGNEIVSSAHLQDGRWVPGQPPDGGWRTFTPDGTDSTTQPTGTTTGIESTADSRTPGTERSTGPPADRFQSRAVDWTRTYQETDSGLQATNQRDRYGRVMFVDDDGRLHTPGDGHGSHRNSAGQLTDTEIKKYTDDNNRPNLENMVRAQEDGDARTVYSHATDGDPTTSELHRQLQETIDQRNHIVEERQRLWNDDIAPILDVLSGRGVDVSHINQASSQTKFNQLMDAANAYLNPEQLDTFTASTDRFTGHARELRLASERLGTLGGSILAGQEFQGGIPLTGGDLTPGTAGNFDRVIVLPTDPPTLVVIEEKGAGATLGARLTGDPTDPNAQVHYSEQGSTDYLWDMLQRDNKLGPHFTEHPDHRQLVERAIREGTIRYLLSRTTEDGTVLVTDFVVNETRLNRNGIHLTGSGSN